MQLYKSFAPYQFLAYWHELWRGYEQLQGPFSKLSPDKYRNFTGDTVLSCVKSSKQACYHEIIGAEAERTWLLAASKGATQEDSRSTDCFKLHLPQRDDLKGIDDVLSRHFESASATTGRSHTPSSLNADR